MTKKSLRVVLLVMIVFVLNANNIFADELTQEEFSRYKNSLTVDQAKVLKLFYGFDEKEKYGDDWEGIAEEMLKSVEKIYELYADALIAIEDFKKGSPEKTDLEKKFRKYWGILNPNEQKVAELYFELKAQGFIKPLLEMKRRRVKDPYKHFAEGSSKIKELPQKLKTEAEFLDFIHEYKKYFSDLQIKLAEAYLVRDANWRKPTFTSLCDPFKSSRRQINNTWLEINATISEIPDILLEEKRVRELIDNHRKELSERQLDFLEMHFFEYEDGKPLSNMNIERRTGWSDSTVRNDLEKAFGIIGYSSKIAFEALLKVIEDYPERFTDKEIKAVKNKDTGSRLYRNAFFKFRRLPEKLLEEAELAKKFDKYSLHLNEQQNIIRKLRLNENGAVIQSWDRVANIMNQNGYRQPNGKLFTEYSVEGFYLRAKNKVEHLFRSSALSPRERERYEKLPIDYGKERPFEGFQFRSRPRGRK